mmetsp:Transcript_12498/g.43455  ORF Transcript_12498/g.43455 Transcript_12498/m.43455 type:complete len:316 (+) Transcript_12498:228-1175(+)
MFSRCPSLSSCHALLHSRSRSSATCMASFGCWALMQRREKSSRSLILATALEEDLIEFCSSRHSPSSLFSVPLAFFAWMSRSICSFFDSFFSLGFFSFPFPFPFSSTSASSPLSSELACDLGVDLGVSELLEIAVAPSTVVPESEAAYSCRWRKYIWLCLAFQRSCLLFSHSLIDRLEGSREADWSLLCVHRKLGKFASSFHPIFSRNEEPEGIAPSSLSFRSASSTPLSLRNECKSESRATGRGSRVSCIPSTLLSAHPLTARGRKLPAISVPSATQLHIRARRSRSCCDRSFWSHRLERLCKRRPSAKSVREL